MITEIRRQKGDTPARLLDYLASSRRLGARLVAAQPASVDPRAMPTLLEDLVRAYRPRQRRFVKHMMLSFAPEDPVERLPLAEIVSFYLERMGYAEAPSLAYLHEDTAHKHIHIVTTPTTFRGEAISESWDWPRSERVAREIEERWQLRRVASSKLAPRKDLSRGELAAAERTGEAPARKVFQNEIAETALRAKTFLEFLARVEARGFSVRVRLASTGELAGLSFARAGVAFRGAHLGRDFRGPRFLEAFALTYRPREDAEAVRSGSYRALPPPSAPPVSPREVAMADPVPEASPLDAPQVRPEGPQAPAVPSPAPAPRPLPPDSYQVAAVPPAVLAHPSRRIERSEVAFARSGWSEQ
nr:relaxase/mobilization nuclease domain-containing protein [Thermoanaerobaculia bacterium]